jgi:hypothetical protein
MSTIIPVDGSAARQITGKLISRAIAANFITAMAATSLPTKSLQTDGAASIASVVLTPLAEHRRQVSVSNVDTIVGAPLPPAVSADALSRGNNYKATAVPNRDRPVPQAFPHFFVS